MNERLNRQYDVVVWGASGFTGRLVAEYLLDRYGVGAELDWAIGGRNQSKLESIRSELGGSAKDLPIVIGDSNDVSSLDAMTAQTRVICSTVGPYSLYGSELVAACVRNGTDYCDLAGEPHWIRQMIDQHHEAARASGARIVNSCGFDSIPSDLGVYYLNRQAEQKLGSACSQIKLRVKAIKGTASGGTVASMLTALDAARADRSVARMLNNPYGLNPAGETSGPDKPDLQGAAYDEDLDCWIAPFVMAAINTRIVRRSNALTGYAYGRDFRYDEAVIVGKGFAGRLKAMGNALALGGFVLGNAFGLSRKLIAGRLPKPGEGPTEAQRKKGFFNLLLLGKLADGRTIRAKVTGDRDPGYGSTSKMLGESAVCLAKDLDDSVAGGLLTPVSAMAEQLLPRMIDHAGLTFEVVE